MSRKKKQAHVNHERWMVSYADFVTLLFAFFVVMFASSQQDHKKAQQAEDSIRAAFQSMGIFAAVSKVPNLSTVSATPPAAEVAMEDDFEASPKVMADLNRIKVRMEQLLAPEIAKGTVAISIGREGLTISLREAGFFESGSAIPIASSLPTLNAIGRAIAATPYNVRIEGHTDNVPIRNDQFASNWELSTTRATVLTRLFIETDQIIPNRLAAAGYAEYHPVASNRTAAGRSRNRRVDIIVLPTRQLDVRMEHLAAGLKAAASSPPEDKNQQQLQKFLPKASHSGFSLAEQTTVKPIPLH